MICLVYIHINTIHININYICTYSKYPPSSDNFCKHLSVTGRLSSLTQRYCSCSCPWPGRTAAWQRQEQLLKKLPICHPEQPYRLNASPCPPAPGQGLGGAADQEGQVYCQPFRGRLQAVGCSSRLYSAGAGCSSLA